MATVSYEILTKVRRDFYGGTLRAYAFDAQVIIKEMSPHNFAQLNLPVNGDMAIIPFKGHIPTKTEKTDIALKTAITQRMNAVKVKYEKLLKPVAPEREIVQLTATGNYKDVLSAKNELIAKAIPI